MSKNHAKVQNVGRTHSEKETCVTPTQTENTSSAAEVFLVSLAQSIMPQVNHYGAVSPFIIVYGFEWL